MKTREQILADPKFREWYEQQGIHTPYEDFVRYMNEHVLFDTYGRYEQDMIAATQPPPEEDTQFPDVTDWGKGEGLPDWWTPDDSTAEGYEWLNQYLQDEAFMAYLEGWSEQSLASGNRGWDLDLMKLLGEENLAGIYEHWLSGQHIPPAEPTPAEPTPTEPPPAEYPTASDRGYFPGVEPRHTPPSYTYWPGGYRESGVPAHPQFPDRPSERYYGAGIYKQGTGSGQRPDGRGWFRDWISNIWSRWQPGRPGQPEEPDYPPEVTPPQPVGRPYQPWRQERETWW